jgi:hypothetical protein
VATIGSASSFASYAWTNSQKFDSPFGYPLEKYQLFKLVPRRREILVENGGTLLHLDALPTTLVQYFRPDAFALDSGFPWIGAPRWRPDVVGDRTFEVLDRSASLSATMPVIVVLAAVGVVAVVVARGRSARLAAVRIPLVASALAATPVLVFIAVTQRYSGDLLPVLFVAALAGLYAIRSRIRAPAPHPWLLGALAVTLAALAGWGVLANYGIARDYQRGHLPPVDGEGQSADAISSGSGRVGAVPAPRPRIR